MKTEVKMCSDIGRSRWAGTRSRRDSREEGRGQEVRRGELVSSSLSPDLTDQERERSRGQVR